MGGNKDGATFALHRHIVLVPWVLWVHPCIHPEQRGPAAAHPPPLAILMGVLGVQHDWILATKPLCLHGSSNGL